MRARHVPLVALLVTASAAVRACCRGPDWRRLAQLGDTGAVEHGARIFTSQGCQQHYQAPRRAHEELCVIAEALGTQSADRWATAVADGCR